MILFFLILSLLLNIGLGIGVINLMRTTERYEDYIEVLRVSMKNIIGSMRSIDFRGAFEADDEVGFIFKGLLGLVNSLEEFVSEE